MTVFRTVVLLTATLLATLPGCMRPASLPLDAETVLQEKLSFWKEFFGRPLLPAQEAEVRKAQDEARSEVMPLQDEEVHFGRGNGNDVFLCMTGSPQGNGDLPMAATTADLTAEDFEQGRQPFALNMTEYRSQRGIVISLHPGARAWKMVLHLRASDGAWVDYASEVVPRNQKGVFFKYRWKTRPFTIYGSRRLDTIALQCFIGPMEDAPTTFMGNESSGAFFD